MIGRMRMTDVLRMLAISVAALTASCSEFHAKDEQGGETHFLKECSEDGCPNDLSCVCGVCTTTCANDGACSALGDQAACEGTSLSSFVCGDEVPPAQICDAMCSNDTQCEARGEGYECVNGRCRPEAIATAVAAHDECDDGGCEDTDDPLVLIVLDTSGSMERKTDCMCTTASCIECLPQCSADGSEKNRWTQALEPLTGTFDDFSCEAKERTDPDTHDFMYQVPHHEPKGVQRADGILQTYATRVRFGIATMDAITSYGRDVQRSIEEYSFSMAAEEAGNWSYPAARDESEVESRPEGWPVGSYRYPGCPNPYFMNTGIRNRDATSGALTVELASGDESATEQAIRQTLLAVRPYGSTPIAAALDDVRALFELDPTMSAERDNPKRPHVILITDGRPDDDYRASNCDCNDPESGKSCEGLLRSDEIASDMHCPYPTPEDAARALRCGASEACDAGLVSALHVVGFAISDDNVAREKMDAIASAGGTERSALVNSGSELRAALAAILDSILSGAAVENPMPAGE
jgi:hypothetical protein